MYSFVTTSEVRAAYTESDFKTKCLNIQARNILKCSNVFKYFSPATC